MTDPRTMLRELFAAGVAAVEPRQVVTEALATDDGPAPTAILAVGKAAVAMAWGATQVFGHRPGLVVSHQPGPVPPGMTHLVAGHPLPDDRSLAAGQAALDLATSLDIDQRLLVLISGGSSALLEAPQPGVSVADLATLTDQLLRSGASINEINAVRSAASRIKAGGLRKATRAQVTTLAISDIVGDDPQAIGSGPTVAPVGPPQAKAVLDRYQGQLDVSPALDAAAASFTTHPHTTGRGDYRIVASGATAVRAVAAAAGDAGLAARQAAESLTGDAAEAARTVIASGIAGQAGLEIYAGETTLEVTGPGAGGRCQHAALVAATEIEGRDDIVFLAAGTDGRDGPTDAAGAIVDGGSVERARSAGHTAATHLVDFDSHPWLAASGDLIETGPTGTNVGDLWLVWRNG